MDIYFWRQFLTLTAGLMYSITCGFALGYPTVLNLAITSKNTTDIHTTSDHATWIGAINGFGGILGCLILSPIMDIFGRRSAQCWNNVFIGTGWIILSLAKDVIALYFGRFIQGISICNAYIMCTILGEFVHPSRRGYFITIKKVTMSLGVFLCHAMSAFWSWRQIAIFAAVPPVIGIILTIMLPESPSYLALIGKFEESEKSFLWLMGDSIECQKELKTLIERHKKMNARNDMVSKYKLTELLQTLKQKDFRKEILISSMLSLILELSARYFILAYAIQIMRSLVTSQSSALYFTLGADMFITIALALSSLVVKNFKRRTILFSSGISAVVVMVLISAMIYAHTFFKLSDTFLWSIAFILILQCFIVNVGLVPVSFAYLSEIFSLKHKGLAICVSDLVFTLLSALFLKVTPIMMEKIGLYSVYGIFGAILGFSLIVLFKIVPETKDKTLQDIQDELNGLQTKEVRERVSLMR